MSAGRPIKSVLAPVVRMTLRTSAFERLVSCVVNGTWKAGDRIPPERQLCRQLGIARTSLREALKAMELIGMIESRVGDGTFVHPRSEFLSRPLLWAFTGTDQKDLREIMEAREFLEQDLAGLAAKCGTDAEIASLGTAIEDMRICLAQGKSVLEVDLQFHDAIAVAAHNHVMATAVQMLRNLLRHWVALKLMIPGVPESVIEQHEEIYRAVEARDVPAARRTMLAHLEKTGQLVDRVFQKQERARISETRKNVTSPRRVRNRISSAK
jgi:GntR family transcriptional repressor for pyruvate dehydrogenase complex